MSHVVVVGGGAIGTSCAYHLAKRGARVTLVDGASPGSACSSGNLGWVVPSLCEPLPAPGLAWQSLRWMLRRDSPLFIDPRFAISSPRWLWRFWRRCNARDHHRGLAALGELGPRAFAHFDALEADGVSVEMHARGVLFLFESAAAHASAFAEFDALAARGLADPVRLSRADVDELEPGLSAEVIGAVLVRNERHVRPETLCAGLLSRFAALGGQVQPEAPVDGVERAGGTIRAVRTPLGAVSADAFVIAAGAWSGVVARRFGFELPMTAGKGYSITFEAPCPTPRHPLYLHERRVGLTPFDGAVRVGGTMELSGLNSRIVDARAASIGRAAIRCYPALAGRTGRPAWAGLRPLTPDGLPFIGRAPRLDNVFVACGHAMLGITLAPVTGSLIADLVTGASTIDLTAFDPARPW